MGPMDERKESTIVQSIHGCMGPAAAQGVGPGRAVADSESRKKLGAKA